jgi:hypothetical protein
VRDLAVGYARLMAIPVPSDPDSNLASMLREISTPDYQPSKKTVVVDESVTKDDIQGMVIFRGLKASLYEWVDAGAKFCTTLNVVFFCLLKQKSCLP